MALTENHHNLQNRGIIQMANKIPVFLCHTNILSGVTSWGFKMKKAFEGHPKYEIILTHMWRNQNGDDFDIQFPNAYAAYEHFDSHSPSIVIPNYNWQLLQNNRAKKELKFIGMCHSDSELEYYLPLSRHESSISKFIAVSPTCSDKLASWIPNRESDIETLPYGINVPKLLKRSYQNNPIRLIYGGRVVQEQKRVFDFVALTKCLLDLKVNFTFDIVGDGKDLPILKEKFLDAGIADHANLLGQIPQEEMPNLWKSHDIFLQVSDYEGTSISMLESMGQGAIPVVTSASSGVDNVITHGDNGFIVPVGDMEQMAQVIKELSHSSKPLTEVGQNAYENSKQFSIETYVESFTSILDEVSNSFSTAPNSQLYSFPKRGTSIQPNTTTSSTTIKSEQISYLICTIPRSGSNWLCDLLRNTGFAGVPREYFYMDDLKNRLHDMFKNSKRDIFHGVNIDDINEYLNAINLAAKTDNNVFGVKIMSAHFKDLIQNIRTNHITLNGPYLSSPEIIESIFPNPKYIRLLRRDKVKQAISYYKAHQSNVWYSLNSEGSQQSPNLVYDGNSISRILRSINLQEAYWEVFFKKSNISPLTLIYEDIIGNPVETIDLIFDFLQIPVGDKSKLKINSPSKKLSDTVSKEWYERFIHESDLEDEIWWEEFENKDFSREVTESYRLNQSSIAKSSQLSNQPTWTSLSLEEKDLPNLAKDLNDEETYYYFWLGKEVLTGNGAVLNLAETNNRLHSLVLSLGIQNSNDANRIETPIYSTIKSFEDLSPNKHLEDLEEFSSTIRLIDNHFCDSSWVGIPIELLIIDTPNDVEELKRLLQNYKDYLVPNYSKLVFKNILKPDNQSQVNFLKKLSEYLVMTDSPKCNSLTFELKNSIPKEFFAPNGDELNEVATQDSENHTSNEFTYQPA